VSEALVSPPSMKMPAESVTGRNTVPSVFLGCSWKSYDQDRLLEAGTRKLPWLAGKIDGQSNCWRYSDHAI